MGLLKKIGKWISGLFKKDKDFEFSGGGRDLSDIASEMLHSGWVSLGLLKSNCSYSGSLGTSDVHINHDSAATASSGVEYPKADGYVRITRAFVTFTYQCGVPVEATLTGPGAGNLNTYEFIFPSTCSTEYTPGDSRDDYLMNEVSCFLPEDRVLNWLTTAQDWAKALAFDWDYCAAGVGDDAPYAISEFTPAVGLASSILYGDWSFDIAKRDEIRYEAPQADGSLAWVSRCDGMAVCGNADPCYDIQQVVLTVEFEFYPDGSKPT